MIGLVLDNRYKLTDFIGQGGMALVYKALDMRTHHAVAIKILKPEYKNDEEFLRRFGVESRKDLPTVTPDQEAEIAQEVEKEVKYRFGLETSETEARENDAAENREEGQQEAAEGQEKAPEEN